MATHSSTLAWRIPWTEEPGRLQSMGSQRVRHDWATSLHSFHTLSLEKEMATHSNILIRRIPWTEEPGGPWSMGSQRVRHNWSDWAHTFSILDICLSIPSLQIGSAIPFFKIPYISVNIWYLFFSFWFTLLYRSMAPHSSTLAWKIPWMEEPGRLQSMGSLRVGYN